MRIVQHRSNYFTGFENKEVEYSTLEELFSIDFVKNFSTQENFSKYSLSPKAIYGEKDWPDFLMAEYHDGISHSWWVVGKLFDNTIELPPFIPTYVEKLLVFHENIEYKPPTYDTMEVFLEYVDE